MKVYTCKIKYLSVFIFLFLSLFGQSQNIGFGADVQYNFQTESIGAGVRVNIFPNSRLSIVPQFSYYFPFNKINEYYAGLALEYKMVRANRFNLYVVGQGAYNVWLNYASSPMENAKPNNWNLEGGFGITTNTCLRPYLEYRYNLKFQETHLRIGLLYVFGCKVGGGGNRSKRCQAYNTN